jgi:hypothetical protein
MESMETKPKAIKNLGWANGWGETLPKEYQDHREAVQRGEKHHTEGSSGGRCVSHTVCHTCGISWSIDSSD